MITILNVTELAIATLFAIAAAAAFSWISLRITFALMHPATARRIAPRAELARGTTQLARVFATNR